MATTLESFYLFLNVMKFVFQNVARSNSSSKSYKLWITHALLLCDRFCNHLTCNQQSLLQQLLTAFTPAPLVPSQ